MKARNEKSLEYCEVKYQKKLTYSYKKVDHEEYVEGQIYLLCCIDSPGYTGLHSIAANSWNFNLVATELHQNISGDYAKSFIIRVCQNLKIKVFLTWRRQ